MPRRKTLKKQKGGYKMKEKIIKFKINCFKKYTAFIKNNKTKKLEKYILVIVDINIKTEPL